MVVNWRRAPPFLVRTSWRPTLVATDDFSKSRGVYEPEDFRLGHDGAGWAKRATSSVALDYNLSAPCLGANWPAKLPPCVSALIPPESSPRLLSGYTTTYSFGCENTFVPGLDANIAGDEKQYQWVKSQLEGLDRNLVKPGVERGLNPYHFLIVRVDGEKLDMEVIGVNWGNGSQPYRSNKVALQDPAK